MKALIEVYTCYLLQHGSCSTLCQLMRGYSRFASFTAIAMQRMVYRKGSKRNCVDSIAIQDLMPGKIDSKGGIASYVSQRLQK